MQCNGNGPRRTKVKGKAGIYFREVRDLGRTRRRYEITYLDSDGKRRWQTIPGYDNLDDAEATLVSVKAKMNGGTRVAPSRLTFAGLADEWLGQLNVGERTRDAYEANLRLYLLPRFGRRRAQEVSVDDVARLVASMHKAGKAGWTRHGVLTTLSSLMSWAVRRGMVPLNPVRQLERAERPKVAKKKQCIFEADQIPRLIEATSLTYRPLIATAVFSGLRIMELLGLRWCDLDFERGYIHVRHQLGRDGKLKALKTTAAERDVVLFRELAALLRRHKASSRFSSPNDFVFASATGTPFNYRNVQTRGFDSAVVKAKLGLDRNAKPVFHDCRHTFASLLVSKGLDLVFISRQLGHANPATTLRVYTHLFDKANHADNMRDALSAQFGGLLDGNKMETAPRNGTKHHAPVLAQLSAVSK